MQKAQEWYLIKKNWMQELEDLSDGDFGKLLRSLFFNEEPDGNLKILYKALRDEFIRVNLSREETLRQKKLGSDKGVKARAKIAKEAKEKAYKTLTSGEPVVNRTYT